MRWLVPEMGPSFHVIPVSGAAIRFPLISWVSFSRSSWFSVSQNRKIVGKAGQKVNKDKKNGFTRIEVSPRASPKLEVCAGWGQGELDSCQGNFDSRTSSFKILEYEGEKKIHEMQLSKQTQHAFL